MNRVELVKTAKAAADQLLQTKGYVSLVDVLLVMGRLSKANRFIEGITLCPMKLRLDLLEHLTAVISVPILSHDSVSHRLS